MNVYCAEEDSMPQISNLRLKTMLQELSRLGSPVDLSVADEQSEFPKVEIVQIGAVDLARIVELEDHRLACIAEVSVINRTSRDIAMTDVELRAARDGRPFEWLQPTQVAFRDGRKTGREASYSLPGVMMRFDYDEVLNHRLIDRGRLPSRRELQGYLIAIGMPAPLKHGQQYELSLTIVTADNAEYSATLHLVCERRPVRKLAKPRPSIFAHSTEHVVAAPDTGRSKQDHGIH
jgi:hypothetical protein